MENYYKKRRRKQNHNRDEAVCKMQYAIASSSNGSSRNTKNKWNDSTSYEKLSVQIEKSLPY